MWLLFITVVVVTVVDVYIYIYVFNFLIFFSPCTRKEEEKYQNNFPISIISAIKNNSNTRQKTLSTTFQTNTVNSKIPDTR